MAYEDFGVGEEREQACTAPCSRSHTASAAGIRRLQVDWMHCTTYKTKSEGKSSAKPAERRLKF
uniref:Uncharacterized protein n=1 Tax=Leersia perrieri TaxID=77586 RepID=A0A0D9WSB2_9ORYZ